MSYKLSKSSDRHRFREQYGPWAIVGGASEGIGEAFCHHLAMCGINLIMVARRKGPLDDLAATLTEQFDVQIETVSADLSRESIVEELADTVGDKVIGLLVYNAAASTVGEFLKTDVASKLTSIKVNCQGPVLLSQAYGAEMAERGKGGIVLMSSMSAFQGAGMVATYAATKAFMLILGEGLWEEMKPRGVDVIVCVAGATNTPNFLEDTPVDKRAKGFPGSPDAVAKKALEQLGAGPVTIPGALNNIAAGMLQKLMSRKQAVKFFSAKTREMYDEE